MMLCTPNATKAPTNSNFEAFGGPMARARWALWPLRGSPWVLKYPYCHQKITKPILGQRRVSIKRRILKNFQVPKSRTS